MPGKRAPVYRAVLPCPVCGSGDVYVQDSRGTAAQDRITRKRVCAQCRHSWRTTEFSDIAYTDAEGEAIVAHATSAVARRKPAA